MKPYKIVILGDSNTEGYGLPNGEDFYPYKIQKALSNTIVYNMGVSGSCVINTTLPDGTIVGMPYVRESKFREALSIPGDLFIINLGTNDGQDGKDDVLDIQYEERNLIVHKERFKSDYLAIIEEIKKLHPKAQFLLCKPIPVLNCIWRKHQQVYVAEVTPYIEAIAKENNITLIDLFKTFMDLGSKQIDNYYLSDGLHLNEKGTELVAQQIVQSILSCKGDLHYEIL